MGGGGTRDAVQHGFDLLLCCLYYNLPACIVQDAGSKRGAMPL